jgi:lipoprotein signal peptidase
MIALALTTAVVLVGDQALKLLLRARQFATVGLGPLGTVRQVEGRLWVHRLGKKNRPKALWLWLIAAGALVVASAWIPSAQVYVGLVLGGSLSNALERSLRGSVTDYVCLRFWPAFNLADVALTAGAIGIAVALLRAVSRTVM